MSQEGGLVFLYEWLVNEKGVKARICSGRCERGSGGGRASCFYWIFWGGFNGLRQQICKRADRQWLFFNEDAVVEVLVYLLWGESRYGLPVINFIDNEQFHGGELLGMIFGHDIF